MDTNSRAIRYTSIGGFSRPTASKLLTIFVASAIPSLLFTNPAGATTYYRQNNASVTITSGISQTILTATIPSGSWIINADELIDISSSDYPSFECDLTVNSLIKDSRSFTPRVDLTINLHEQAVVSLSTPSNVELSCKIGFAGVSHTATVTSASLIVSPSGIVK